MSVVAAALCWSTSRTYLTARGDRPGRKALSSLVGPILRRYGPRHLLARGGRSGPERGLLVSVGCPLVAVQTLSLPRASLRCLRLSFAARVGVQLFSTISQAKRRRAFRKGSAPEMQPGANCRCRRSNILAKGCSDAEVGRRLLLVATTLKAAAQEQDQVRVGGLVLERRTRCLHGLVEAR